MADEIISRADAKAKGLRFYFTGKPCKHGHTAPRKTVNATCVICHEETLARWRVDNADRIRETDRAYWRGNTERKRRKDQRWRYSHLEEVRARDRVRYANGDRELHRKHRRDRKARVKGAEGSHTQQELDALFEKQKHKCIYCFSKITPKTRHLDHIVALARGGSNYISNLQWTCESCNLRKHAKDPIVFANQNGRLL